MAVLSIDNIQTLSLLGVSVGLASLFVTWFIVSTILSWYRLRHVPGPFLASFTHAWMVKTILLNKLRDDFINLTKYGPIARIAPNYILTSDPEILRQVGAVRNNYSKDEWFDAVKFAPGTHSMFSIIENRPHDQRKAMARKGYNGSENSDLEFAVDSQIAYFIDVVRRKHLSAPHAEARYVDLVTLTRYFTLDVITRLAYGKAFGFLDADEDLYGYTASMDRTLKAQNLSQDIPFLKWVVGSRPYYKLFGAKPTDKKGIGKIMGVTKKLIRERFEDEKHIDDMMGSFMRHGMTEEECGSEAMIQIIAGSDTTAIAIRTTLMYLVATPRVYLRLKKMIKETVERNEVSTPITYEEAQKIPYLRAVVLEGIRMRIPTPYGHFKKVPPEGDVINGMFIPGGTAIGHNSLAITRSKAIFGEDVDVFRPERFLECDEKTRAERSGAIDILFGKGRWTCAGKPLAMLELHKVFFEWLRVFDFQLINPCKGWDEVYYFFAFQTNMWVSITEAEK
ncbi:cytochrome P450 monooxygenase [Daldinia bambusicola]|nr:cytochrome P450 monooxygenase [Daldinia bambusicola]